MLVTLYYYMILKYWVDVVFMSSSDLTVSCYSRDTLDLRRSSTSIVIKATLIKYLIMNFIAILSYLILEMLVICIVL